MLRFFSGWISVFAFASTPVSLLGSTDAENFFEQQVRPLLIESCIGCHGPDEQEGGLRLDSRRSILLGGDSGPAIVPGFPERSGLVKAVRYLGERKMPPNRRLDPGQIKSLEIWVRNGAVWPDSSSIKQSDLHRRPWSLLPLAEVAVPATESQGGSPADAFVNIRLRKTGLKPASIADRRTLLRRLTVDLTGRLPTADEVSAFKEDDGPLAWSRQVDRLLASPEYGERWARFWLDIARYADNKGYVFFEDSNYPWAWTFRDYVIRSWNADKPFNRFVMEQLAADQIELSDSADLAALGFLTVGGHFMNNTHDIIDDRIDVITRGLLGLTVTCARCHDHKYDPLSQADYYALYGVLRSSEEPVVPPLLEQPPETAAHEKFQKELDLRAAKLNRFVVDRFDRLQSGARTRVDEYLLAAFRLSQQPSTENFMLIADPEDVNPTMIVRWQKHLERVGPNDSIWGPWIRMQSVSDERFNEAFANLGVTEPRNELTAWHSAIAAVLADSSIGSRDQLAARYGKVFRSVESEWRKAIEHDPGIAALSDPDQESLRLELYGPGTPPSIPPTLGWGFLSLFPDRKTQNEFKAILKEVETWLVSENAPPRAMVLLDRAEPFQPRIFERGNPHQPGKPVARRFPEVLDPQKTAFQHGSGRLELSRRIVAEGNPLTARVIVNRIWQHHFGTGLVRTPDDFGNRSEPPSHPDLLDFLAGGLIRHDWSIKWLHRQILLSDTYRRDSALSDATRRIDPENRWLSHVTRRRLQFEALRDNLLGVSDRLDRRMFGPSQKLLDSGPARRTVYARIDRMDVPSLLTTFDFPNPAASSSRRDSTTVPPQALFLWNSPFVLECARSLASLIHRQSDDRDQRLENLYGRLFQRSPDQRERRVAERILGSDGSQDRWTLLAHTLLMTNEFLFID